MRVNGLAIASPSNPVPGWLMTGMVIPAKKAEHGIDCPQHRPGLVDVAFRIAAKANVKRRWFGEQGSRVSGCFDELPEQPATLEAACEPSIVSSLWPPPA